MSVVRVAQFFGFPVQTVAAMPLDEFVRWVACMVVLIETEVKA